MRREFTKLTKRDAFVNCDGHCESCHMRLRAGEARYDHRIPDGLGGEPTLENCQVLCRACHDAKTRKKDVPTIAHAKRVIDAERGIRKPTTLRSRGFEKRSPQRSASRPIERTSSTCR